MAKKIIKIISFILLLIFMALFAANSIGTKVTFPSAQFVEDYNEYAHYNYGKFSYNVISTSGDYYWMDLVTGSYVPNGFQ